MNYKAVVVSLFVLFGTAGQAFAWEQVCSQRVDREIASTYIQEVGLWQRKVNDKWQVRVGVKVWDIYKSCFILQEKANLTITVRSSAGGYAQAGIHWDPRAHLKGSWAYKTFKDTFLKDCGGGWNYKVKTYCD